MNLKAQEAAINAELCRRSLYHFLKYFWDVIVPDDFVDNWHIKYLCDELQAVAGRVFERKPSEYDLIVNVPPGTSKSTIGSVMFPAWCWVNDPPLRFIGGSHDSDLAAGLAIKSRDILKSDKFNELYPGLIVMKNDMDLKRSYENTKQGSRKAVGVGGNITGSHAHIILVDDPINPKKAVSAAELKTAAAWMSETLSTRKVDKKLTPTILIMQRLAEGDPTGVLLEKDRPIRHICLPAELTDLDNVSPKEAEENYIDGLLDPKRMDREALALNKTDLGSRGYANQFLQNSVAAEGDIFKRSWWKWYEVLSQKRPDLIVHSWDTAHKKGQENDFAVCTIWAVFPEGYYLVDGWAEKAQFPELRRQAILLDTLHPATDIIIEDRSSGQDLIPELQATTKLPVKAVKVVSDKIARAKTCVGTIEAGNVYLPKDNIFAAQLVEQCAGFPALKHDDIVDSLTLFLNWMRERRTGPVAFTSRPRERAHGLTSGYGGKQSLFKKHLITRGFHV
jgi:predicted phage terminase large subunit-like protein